MTAGAMRSLCSGPRACGKLRAPREVYRDWVRGYPGNGFGVKPLLWSPDGSEVYFGSEVAGFVQVMAAQASGDVPAGSNRTRVLTPAPCVNQDWILGASPEHARPLKFSTRSVL